MVGEMHPNVLKEGLKTLLEACLGHRLSLAYDASWDWEEVLGQCVAVKRMPIR